jgi:hypothetical protein
MNFYRFFKSAAAVAILSACVADTDVSESAADVRSATTAIAQQVRMPDGSDVFASRSPKTSGADAYRVLTDATQSKSLMLVALRNGAETYRVLFSVSPKDGNIRTTFFGTKQASVSLMPQKSDANDRCGSLVVGETTADLCALRNDLRELAAALSPAATNSLKPANGANGDIRTQINLSPRCLELLGLFAVAAQLFFATGTLGACTAGEVLTLGSDTWLCVAGVASTLYVGTQLGNSATEVLYQCRR